MAKLAEVITNYIAERRKKKEEEQEKKEAAERKTLSGDLLATAEKEAVWISAKKEITTKFLPVNWLTDAAKRAWQINFSTHAPKFTHGDARGSGALVKANSAPHYYLSTSNLKTLENDVVGNAAAFDVANCLLLEGSEGCFLNLLQQGDLSFLRAFSEDAAQINAWLLGFSEAWQNRAPSSHTLAKQIYFPIDDGKYHLLSPLFATSLAQVLYEKIEESKFGEAAKEARAAKKKEAHSDFAITNFPNLAVQTFGGANPQGISRFNYKRLGKMYLLNCQAPNWQSEAKPPPNEAAFWRQYRFFTRPLVQELKDFLISVAEQESHLKMRERRAKAVDRLIDALHQFAARWQNQEGWSEAYDELSLPLRHWLDPQNKAPDFVASRNKNDWQDTIGAQFATWLNRQFQDTKLDMKDAEHEEWHKEVTRQLTLYKDDWEVLA